MVGLAAGRALPAVQTRLFETKKISRLFFFVGLLPRLVARECADERVQMFAQE